MRSLLSVVSLFRNNSSLLTVPATSFCIFLLIAGRSHLPADDLYFFLSALFALCTVLDGGVPYKIVHGAGNGFTLLRACRTVFANLVKAAPVVGAALLVLIAVSPFAEKSGHLDVVVYGCLGLLVAIFKVMADTARVASLKTPNRVATDQLTSGFGVARLLIVLIIAGRIPYLPVYGLTLVAELYGLCRLNAVKPLAMVALRRSTWRQRFRFDASYVQANLAYNAAFNIDRLAAFYILAPNLYRGLIGITSLYNMSILPHKLVENELLFPSTQKASFRFAQAFIPATFCGAGVLGLAIAMHVLGHKFSTEPLHTSTYVAAALWVLITAYYNRLWSVSLRDFNISYLAKVNLVASAAAIVVAATGFPLYQSLIPAGLLAYSAVNFIGLIISRRSSASDLAIYLAAAVTGGLLSLPIVLYLPV